MVGERSEIGKSFACCERPTKCTNRPWDTACALRPRAGAVPGSKRHSPLSQWHHRGGAWRHRRQGQRRRTVPADHCGCLCAAILGQFVRPDFERPAVLGRRCREIRYWSFPVKEGDAGVPPRPPAARTSCATSRHGSVIFDQGVEVGWDDRRLDGDELPDAGAVDF